MGTPTLSTLQTAEPDARIIADAFSQALGCARAFEGATAPNPPVGCAILDQHGEILTLTAHQKAGQLHAEALAIAQCRQDGSFDRIHTFVVTLEPCAHTGRTPPCASAILQTPAKSVWIGVEDRNPSVQGGGADLLAAAGLDVHFIANLNHPQALDLAQSAERLIAPFAKRQCRGMPFVTVKQALDRNGGMIPPAGSTTFTSEKSLTLAHQLRKRADAILTGSGTILADNPAFTVRRIADFPNKQRHLVILDRRGRVPETYITAARERGFDVRIETDVQPALARLAEVGVLEVLVEAGPLVTATVLEQELWDEHVTITQAADPSGEDHVSIVRFPIPDTPITGRSAHVLRNH